jgi:hypothetical protein
MTAAKDLSREAPASPRLRTRGYAILSRMADKGRAELAGTLGGYHFDCPLDKALFDFKGVKVEDVRAMIAEALHVRCQSGHEMRLEQLPRLRP